MMPYNPDIISRAYNQCPRIHFRDTTNLSQINLQPDLNPLSECNNQSNPVPNQTNGIDGNCLIDSLIDELTKYAITNGIESIPKLKPFVNIYSENNIQEYKIIKSGVNNMLRSMCPNKNPVLVYGVSQTIVPLCDPRGIQGATDLTSCMINKAQEIGFEINQKIKNNFEQKLNHSYWILGLIFILIIVFIAYILE